MAVTIRFQPGSNLAGTVRGNRHLNCAWRSAVVRRHENLQHNHRAFGINDPIHQLLNLLFAAGPLRACWINLTSGGTYGIEPGAASERIAVQSITRSVRLLHRR